MSYIGKEPANSFISFEKQVFTIVNSQTAYTLNNSVTNENDIRLVINNVIQEPGTGKAYTASGTTLTLSEALVNGTDEMYCVYLGRALQTVNAPSNSVGSSQVEASIITGQTELATTPASTDELLISDAGTLKRIDASLIGGQNTPAFAAYAASDFTMSSGTFTTSEIDTEYFDSDSAFDTSTHRFTPQTAGKYFFYGTFRGGHSDNNCINNSTISLSKNGSTFSYGHSSSDVTSSNVKGAYMSITGAVELNGSTDYVELRSRLNMVSQTPTVYDSYFGGYKIIGA